MAHRPAPPDLPLRDGVGASTVSVPAGPWPTLLAFLVARFPAIDAAVWQQRLQAGLVLDDAGRAFAPDAAHPGGQRVHYYRAVPDEPAVPFAAEILHCDAELLVADKPHFLPTIPSGRHVRETLLARLRRDTGIATLAPLHRLDRLTAGLVLFSVNPATRAAYTALFAERRITKHYDALAPTSPVDFGGGNENHDRLRRGGCPARWRHDSRLVPDTPFFRMREVPGTPNSTTWIERCEHVDTARQWSRYRLTPVTGLKHQLRVHMAAQGLGIVGDRWYPELDEDGGDDHARPLRLIARSLAFVDPVSGAARAFVSARPLTG